MRSVGDSLDFLEVKLFLNWQVIGSRISDHTNLTNPISDSDPATEKLSSQGCSECQKWRKWARRAEYSMLEMEKQLIEKEAALRNVIEGLQSFRNK